MARARVSARREWLMCGGTVQLGLFGFQDPFSKLLVPLIIDGRDLVLECAILSSKLE